MIDKTGINWMNVVFLWENERICSFKCENYSEMIRFLHFCKMYEVEFWPRDFDEAISEKLEEKMNGIPGYIYDYWIEYGSDFSIQTIKVEIGKTELF